MKTSRSIVLIGLGLVGIYAATHGHSPWYGMGGVGLVWCGAMLWVWSSHT